MATYGDLKTLVASDLRRSDLANEIAQAILDAIADHDTERFWFNEAAVYSYNTVIGTDDITLAAQAPIQEFIRVDRVKAQIGNTWYDLVYEEWDELDRLFASPTRAQPFRYSWIGSNELRLYPTPNGIFPVRIYGHYRMIPLAADNDSNVWTNRARNLIRYTALKRLYAYPIRDMQQQTSADAAGMRELEYLRRETE